MMRKSGFAVLAAALALVIVTGCESTRAIKNDIKEDIRNEATIANH
jgi:predicted component of type VI protein secretion system